MARALPSRQKCSMFKIITKDTKCVRRLIVEGKFIEPWATELIRAWNRAQEGLEGRKLTIDLNDVSFINHAGEEILLGLIREGAHIVCSGALNRHVLHRLTRKCEAEREAK
jgi:hypothetical protein